MTHRILAISGALRRASTNTRLAAEALRLYAPTEAVWADLRLPLYDGDLEAAEGLPQGVATLIAEIRAAAERRAIESALSDAGGQMQEAARRLGISRTTLWEKMRRFGVQG